MARAQLLGKALNKELFEAFFTQLVGLLKGNPEEKFVIAMDNLGAHSADVLDQCVTGSICCYLLP